ncbi:hypothetical protein [Polyangium sp. 15x6]|uniref:hypothetical protein n=1 Tax=Polyangium sp. 15x6 TaxID=3042687 RepID=UPI00249C3DF5|nr:hypothetical protein [Polyangium sp. 15x6]MDI3288167.1 hypothetical protein [Polyangium sp. 15x6]
MTAALIVKSTLPAKDFTTITQLGLKALNLAVTHAAALGPRLSEGLVQGLSEDIEKLGEAIPGAKQARSEAVAATSAQNVALEQGHAQMQQIRVAVRRAKAPADVKRAYGIGLKVNKTNMRDVKAAIQQILGRTKENPAEAASLGIVAKDLDALAQALVAITNADAVQEQKRASAPVATQERNRTGNRILAAVARIEGAGRMEFANDEANRASFEALGAGARKRKRAEEEAAPPVR